MSQRLQDWFLGHLSWKSCTEIEHFNLECGVSDKTKVRQEKLHLNLIKHVLNCSNFCLTSSFLQNCCKTYESKNLLTLLIMPGILL